MEPGLFGRIQNKIDDQMTIWEQGGCVDLLLQDFQERWPLFNRRMAFFTSEQQANQDVSAWISVLEELAGEAEIESISMEDVFIFRILTGMTNTKIRHELNRIPEPSLKAYKKRVEEMELAWRMETSITKTKKTVAAVVKNKVGKRTKCQSKIASDLCEENVLGVAMPATSVQTVLGRKPPATPLARRAT